jgi:hypothetical protein
MLARISALPSAGKRSSPNFGRNQLAIGSLVSPFEDGHSAGQNFAGFLAGQIGSTPAARLEFRTDISGS